MKQYHQIYYGYSDHDLNKLWENCTFVFDNNVLLDLYRVSSETRKLLLDAMSKYEDRVWLPQQVVHEFYKNRTEVIFESNSRYLDMKDTVEKLQSKTKSDLRLHKMDTCINTNFNDLLAKIDEIKNRDIVVSDPRNDKILDTLLSIFTNKVGPKYSNEELTKLYKDGEQRYNEGTPPGFKDKKKLGHDKYGDFILWKQIIEFSKKEEKHIVFITNDAKDDWWYIVKGKVQGPLYSLREEFISETKYKFHMYTMLNFLEKFTESTGVKVSESIKDDLENLNSRSSTYSNYNLVNGYEYLKYSNEYNFKSHLESFLSIKNWLVNTIKTLTPFYESNELDTTNSDFYRLNDYTDKHILDLNNFFSQIIPPNIYKLRYMNPNECDEIINLASDIVFLLSFIFKETAKAKNLKFREYIDRLQSDMGQMILYCQRLKYKEATSSGTSDFK